MLNDHLIHGCDYNPEQWLDRPDVLIRDATLMREAGINLVSLGVFAWAHHEPEEGVYAFDWIDEAFDRLHAAGVSVCLGTATAAIPPWMRDRYPEVARVEADGTRRPVARRHDFCWTSPVYRAKSAALIHQLGARYDGHPALAAWHVNNEYAGSSDAARCYCGRCVAGFQAWLRNRYRGDLDELNRCWWTAFWSSRYNAWEQIRPGNTGIGALTVNWYAYCADRVADMLAHEIRAIRSVSDKPVTTNLHNRGRNTDDLQLARQLDIVGFDHYPPIDGTAQDTASAIDAAWEGDRVRCLADRPWLLLECCPTQPQYFQFMRAKRPGVHRLMSLQHVAHGSRGVCYFQWRAGRGGHEKMHGAVNMWDADERTRVFGEVAALGADLAKIGPLRTDDIRSDVAVLWDVRAQWYFEANGGLRSVADPRTRAMRWYAALWEANVAADVISPRADMGRYRLILAPGVFMLPEGCAERLASAVREGATVVCDPLTAWVDEEHRIVEGGRPGPVLRALLGVASEEFDCPRADERVPVDATDELIVASGAPVTAVEFCDVLRPEVIEASGTEVLATYADEFYAGRPVVTRRAHGRGEAYYVAATLDERTTARLLLRLCARCGVPTPWADVPAGVQVRFRVGSNGQRVLFAANYTAVGQRIPLPGQWTDQAGDRRHEGGCLDVGPGDVRILVPTDTN